VLEEKILVARATATTVVGAGLQRKG
jgi:hypothetical protein